MASALATKEEPMARKGVRFSSCVAETAATKAIEATRKERIVDCNLGGKAK